MLSVFDWEKKRHSFLHNVMINTWSKTEILFCGIFALFQTLSLIAVNAMTVIEAKWMKLQTTLVRFILSLQVL